MESMHWMYEQALSYRSEILIFSDKQAEIFIDTIIDLSFDINLQHTHKLNMNI